MNQGCRELEKSLREGTLSGDELLERHVKDCAACREMVRGWQEISDAAQSMRRAWRSPGLWSRIEKGLIEESNGDRDRDSRWTWVLSSRWLAAAACATVLMLSVAVGLVLLRSDRSQPGGARASDPEFDRKILTEQALRETEAAEAKYIESIDKLSKLADPLIQKPTSPIMLNYRERLMLLDEAIADCRANIRMNRSNAHLRMELVSIYQEKQRTLLDLMKEKTNDQQ